MEHFKRVTSACSEGKNNAVIMGRRTWESIPKKFRPLPGRLNVVLSRSEVDAPLSATSLENAYAQLEQRDDVQDIFIIGGGQVYKEALEKGLKRIIYTQVEATVDCDTFFPELADSDWVKKPYYHEDGGDKEIGEGATSNVWRHCRSTKTKSSHLHH